MSFNLSFVQSLITANLRQALPWAAGVSVASSAKAILSGNVSPEVHKIVGKFLKSLALSAVINTAAAFLPNRFAVLNSPAAKHAVSAFSTLFVAYLSEPKVAKPQAKPEAKPKVAKPEAKPKVPEKVDVKTVLEQQGIRLVNKNELDKIAGEKENMGIYVVLAWDPTEGEYDAFPPLRSIQREWQRGHWQKGCERIKTL